LAIGKVQARGHIVTLWCWAVSYAQEGDFSQYSDSDVADAAEWEGDAPQFVAALLSSGWMDADRRLHDWDAMGVRLLRSMRERQRSRRAKEGHPEDPTPGAATDGPDIVTLPSRDSSVTVSRLSHPTDPTDPPDLSDLLVEDAPKAREPVDNSEKLKDLDYVLRLYGPELSGWILGIKALIAQENQGRPRNPFDWRPTCGSFEQDMKNLIYKLGDDEKIRILHEAYNTLGERVNWPRYVELAIRYTIRTSEKLKIVSPFAFTMKVMRTPGEIVGSCADGRLRDLAASMRM
jgi:hypothetical protein